MPASTGLALYRIVQESVTNVLRHAEAGAVSVTLRYTDDGVELYVIDDGSTGPGDVVASRPGHGLIGMRERAAGVGGTLTAEPRPSGGFAVHARLPLRPTGAMGELTGITAG